MSNIPSIVLVHGFWGGAAHWANVITELTGSGYDLNSLHAVDNPLTSSLLRVCQQCLQSKYYQIDHIGLSCAHRKRVVRSVDLQSDSLPSHHRYISIEEMRCHSSVFAKYTIA